MIQQKVETIAAFSWQSQLRHRLEKFIVCVYLLPLKLDYCSLG